MGFETYSVAVKLSLINDLSGGLLGISKNFHSLNKDAKEFQQRADAIKKTLAVSGAMMGGGFAMLSMFKQPIEYAIKYEKDILKLKQMGLGDYQIAQAKKFAEGTKIMGTSIAERTKIFAETQGAFRESGMEGMKALAASKVMTPILAKYQVASGMLDEKAQAAASASFQQLNKTIEIMGGLNDANKAGMIADGIFKASQSSGKQLDPAKLRLFLTQAGIAGVGLDMKTIFAGLEPIISELGGDRAGTGLNTAYSRMHGMLALNPSILVHEALKLGIWDKSKVHQTKGGSAKLKGVDPMVRSLSDLQETDSLAFSEKIMGIYKAHGITKLTDMARENGILFGKTGGVVYTKIMQQIEVMKHSEEAFGKALGIEQMMGAAKDSPMMKVKELDAAMDDLKLTVGRDLLPVFTPMVGKFADFARTIGQHPTLIYNVTAAFAGLGAYLVYGGLIKSIQGTAQALRLLHDTSMSSKGGLTGFSSGIRGVGDAVSGEMVGNLSKTAKALRALDGIVGVTAAWQVGSFFGDQIYGAMGNDSRNFIGRWGARAMATLGDEDARKALQTNEKGDWYMNALNRIAPGYKDIGEVINPVNPFAGGLPNFLQSSYNVAPVPPKQTQTIRVEVPVNFNGKEVARIVTEEQTKAASRPNSGISGYDVSRGGAYPGWNSSLFLP